MKQEVVDAFNKQIGKERDASVVYEAISIWCAVNEHKGFSEFFGKQAAEEKIHAEKLIHHLLERGHSPKLGALAAPPADFRDLSSVADAALSHERTNTQGIYDTITVARDADDFAAINLLNWFVNEQVEEEAWANRMVTLVKRATCAGSLYALDRHIVRDLMGDE